MKECNNTTTACGRDPKCCCQCGMDVENIDEQKMGSSMGKFLRTQYYAAKRQGDKIWTAHTGRLWARVEEMSSISEYEKTGLEYKDLKPYIVEMSNGTNFLVYVGNKACRCNIFRSLRECEENVRKNIYILNQH